MIKAHSVAKKSEAPRRKLACSWSPQGLVAGPSLLASRLLDIIRYRMTSLDAGLRLHTFISFWSRLPSSAAYLALPAGLLLQSAYNTAKVQKDQQQVGGRVREGAEPQPPGSSELGLPVYQERTQGSLCLLSLQQGGCTGV